MRQQNTFFATLAKLTSYGTPEAEARRIAYLASITGRREDQQLSPRHQRKQSVKTAA